VNIEDVATVRGFQRDPALVWQWYDKRRVEIATAQPNAAHLALAQLEDCYDRFTLVTQNIDGLHKRAGSRNIIELHGNIWKVLDTVTGEVTELLEVPLKSCPPKNEKGHLLRPAVVWFGEMLPPGALEASIMAAQRCDLCLVVGTSAFVQPAASIPIYAKNGGATVIEFTLQPTDLTGLVDFTCLGKAGETLPPLLDLVRE
jgi:NAD-dependent deacetylase